MVYEVMLACMKDKENIIKQIPDVFDMVMENGVYIFRDTELNIIFSAPSDSIIYIQRISLG